MWSFDNWALHTFERLSVGSDSPSVPRVRSSTTNYSICLTASSAKEYKNQPIQDDYGQSTVCERLKKESKLCKSNHECSNSVMSVSSSRRRSTSVSDGHKAASTSTANRHSKIQAIASARDVSHVHQEGGRNINTELASSSLSEYFTKARLSEYMRRSLRQNRQKQNV